MKIFTNRKQRKIENVIENIRNNRTILLLFLFAFILLIVIIKYIKYKYVDEYPLFRYEILEELAKSLLITIIVGMFAKIISDEFIRIQKNDYKMKDIGIYEIGEGKLDNKQKNIMFGNESLGYKIPSELKFLFISGDNFIKAYKNEITSVINKGCKVKILIADPVKSKQFLNRAEVLCPQSIEEGSYVEQLSTTTKIVNEIKKSIINNTDNKGSIEIRHYHDEYRYNIRIGLYDYGQDNYKYIAWANFQPMIKDSIDLSLTVIGKASNNKISYSSSKGDSNNIVIAMNDAFDKLWELYK